MSPSHDSDELKRLEDTLRSLEPRSSLSRDQLMFAAGRASVPERGWWPHLSGLLALLVVSLAGWSVLKPAPSQQVVYVERFSRDPTMSSPVDPKPIETGDYLRQRQQMIEQGTNGPRTPTATEEQFGPIWTPASRLDIE